MRISDLNTCVYIFICNQMYPICLDGLNFAASVENYFLVCGRKIAEKFGVSDFIEKI